MSKAFFILKKLSQIGFFKVFNFLMKFHKFLEIVKICMYDKHICIHMCMKEIWF